MLEKHEAFLSLKSLVFVGVAWSVIVASLLFWDVRRIRQFTENQAINEARANFKKDMAFRYWAATHGGVYVPIDEKTPPNPYLEQIPERDIATPSGKKLTLMNPAYIMRQVNEYYMDIYGIGGRLTSLKPLNPVNSPDDWEAGALQAFEKGETEVFEFLEKDGKRILRLMRPNLVAKGCLKCHGAQGYKVGDVRGGLSITVPMDQYVSFERYELRDHLLAHGILWLLGLLGVALGYRWLQDLFSARLKTQKALRKSEETRRLLLDNIAEAIFGTDTEGICTFINPACLKMLGYENPDEVVGSKIHSLIHHTHEDGTPYLESECLLLSVIKDGKLAHEGRELLWRKDGSSFFAEIWFHPVFKDGVVTGAVSNFVDITYRLQIEKERARLFTAIEQSGEVIVITDTNGIIQYVNRAFERTTGYSRKEAIGINPRVLKSGKHESEFYLNMWDTLVSGSTWNGNFINKRKDGSLYKEEASISPVKDESGVISGYVAVKRDITQRSMLQKARDYFISVTSHELRTPLTKLGMSRDILESSMASKEVDSPSLKASVGAINASIEEFQNIVDAGEMFTDMALLKKPLALTKMPISTIIKACIEHSRERQKEENRNLEVSLVIDTSPGEDLLECDYSRIHYALNEVISNAVKYTPDGKNVQVHLSREGETVRLAILDEGIGLPSEMTEEVFEPFFSLEETEKHTTGKYGYLRGGIGMGLTLARLIFKAHGGDLELESGGEGKGAKVIMTLPLSQEKPNEE